WRARWRYANHGRDADIRTGYPLTPPRVGSHPGGAGRADRRWRAASRGLAPGVRPGDAAPTASAGADRGGLGPPAGRCPGDGRLVGRGQRVRAARTTRYDG